MFGNRKPPEPQKKELTDIQLLTNWKHLSLPGLCKLVSEAELGGTLRYRMDPHLYVTGQDLLMIQNRTSGFEEILLNSSELRSGNTSHIIPIFRKRVNQFICMRPRWKTWTKAQQYRSKKFVRGVRQKSMF